MDQAASTAVQISGVVLPLTRSLSNANWPFLIQCTSSMPAIVIDAFRKRLNPSIGPKTIATCMKNDEEPNMVQCAEGNTSADASQFDEPAVATSTGSTR